METLETLGKYEIKRPLGRGATGTVYEGWDPVIARRVAIKTVKLPDQSDFETEEVLARFRREAQAAGRLTHPNIVTVFDYGETNDLAYIVMEFVDGPSLKSLLDQHERFTVTDAVRIMEEVLAGLQFSHERGVVHRDIKPANVMLTSSGQAKIADFGIARIESSSITQVGTMLGTPAYMSPEQFMGEAVDARSDIYSAGVVLYQLLTGERPFEGGFTAIMHRALHTDPPAPSRLSVTSPPALDAVVRRAMEKRPGDRFPSAKAFAAAMRAAAAQPMMPEDEITLVTPAALSASGAVVGPPPSRSRLPMIAGVVIILLGGLGGSAWWLLSHRSELPATTSASTTSVPPDVAPTPPAAVAQPTPQQVAMTKLVTLRQRVTDAVNDRSCAVLTGAVADDGSVMLTGLAGRQSADDLRQSIAFLAEPDHIDWHVNAVDPAFCPALDILHPLTTAHLGLQMADGRTRLYDGDRVRVHVVMPNFPSRLRVDYLVHDGSVQHLYPQLADPANGIAADAPHTYAPGDVVELANPAWTVSEPYGTDMIIAVAASEEFFPQPRPSNAEKADVYLRDLQTAVDKLRRLGASVAGSAVTLEALPK